MAGQGTWQLEKPKGGEGGFMRFVTYGTSPIESYRKEQESLQLDRNNAQLALNERQSADAAQERAASMRFAGQQAEALAQMSAAGIKAGAAATNSSRLLTEFVALQGQRTALQQRQADQAQGTIAADFGVAGVKSIGAQIESGRQSALTGNIQASQDNMQKENILQEGRSAITNAFATGVAASGGLAAAQANATASQQKGDIFARQTSQVGLYTRNSFRWI